MKTRDSSPTGADRSAESQRDNSPQHEDSSSEAGRHARKPREIPKAGWWAVLKRTKNEVRRDNLSIVAAGVAFFVLLAMAPALAAVISIYGLVADPGDVQQQIASVSHLLPEQASELLTQQMSRIADESSTAGWGAALGILLALWSGSKGIKALITALNIAYEEEETRGFFKLNLLALGLTLGCVAVVATSVGLIVALPVLLGKLGLGAAAQTAVSALRWPLLLGLAACGMTVLYRYAPDRRPAQWKWVSWGAVAATLLWLGASALFSYYVSNFASYNKTYGSLGAVVILLMWFYVSAFVVLLGAELNAEMEHQTGEDTTKKPERPRGDRGAYVADHLPNEA